MTQYSPHRLRAALWAALGALVLSSAVVSCAPAGTSDGAGLDVEPFATRPHLKIRWRQHLNPAQTWEYRPREYSAPHYRRATDEMYVGTDGGALFKVRGGDGKTLWEERLQGPVHAEPVYGDGRVYAGTLEGHFYALEEQSGDIVWQHEVNAALESKAAFAEGRIFYTTSEDNLIAADAATGKRLWNYKRTAPEYFTIKESARPVVADGVVYCGFADGVLVALQLDTGEVLWQSNLSGGKTEFLDVDHEPVVAGSRIYAASYDGGLYAIDRDSGEHLWRQSLGGAADVTYGEDVLYVASANGRLLAINAEDGEPLWSFRFQDHTPVALSATRLFLFASTSSGPMYVIDRATGVPLVTWDPSTGFNTRVIVGREKVFAFSNLGYLYGVDIAY